MILTFLVLECGALMDGKCLKILIFESSELIMNHKYVHAGIGEISLQNYNKLIINILTVIT